MSYDPRWSWGLTPSSPKPVRQGRADPAESRHDGGEADRAGSWCGTQLDWIGPDVLSSPLALEVDESPSS
jgi:hypothetical protein